MDSDTATTKGSGTDAGGNATDWNAIDGNSTNDSKTDENVSDGPVSVADGGVGVDGIYKSCPPVALTQSYTDPNVGFSLRYPVSWTPSSPGSLGSNFSVLLTSYSYRPTPSSTPIADGSEVEIITGITAVDTADLERRLNEFASGYPSAVVRRFTLGGEPAIAWWFREPPASRGCSPCAADTGPDVINIELDAAKGLSIIQISGSARINAPDQIFCEIQAILASLSP